MCNYNSKEVKNKVIFFITNLQIFIGSEANYGKSINDILFIQRLTWLVGRAAHAFSHLEFHWPLLDVLWVVRCFTVIIIALLAWVVREGRNSGWKHWTVEAMRAGVNATRWSNRWISTFLLLGLTIIINQSQWFSWEHFNKKENCLF